MVVAVSMVRDEADVIEATVRRMAGQVDRLIVADNQSTDGTREILDQLSRELPLEVLDDPEPGYYQSRKMTGLAERARLAGASWVVPFDADEVWLPRQRGTIARHLQSFPPNVLTAEALLFDHIATATDRTDTDPVRRIRWRRPAAAPLRKVAVRALSGLVIHQGNHSASFPGVRHVPTVTTALEIRHFPVRSPEQWVRKARNGAAAYNATDLPAAVGKHWRDWGRLIDEHGEQMLADGFYEHYWSADPESDGSLVFDPCP